MADGDDAFARLPVGDSFVADDAVEAAVLGNVTAWQRTVDADLMALAAEDDFAGWCLPAGRPGNMQIPEFHLPRSHAESPALPFCFEAAVLSETSKRRATPPSVESLLEAGFGKAPASEHPEHRWWIPGTAALLTFGVFSLLLLNQSLQHPTPETDAAAVPFTATNMDPVKPVPLAPTPAPAPVAITSENPYFP
jgi:hypothetical protein